MTKKCPAAQNGRTYQYLSFNEKAGKKGNTHVIKIDGTSVTNEGGALGWVTYASGTTNKGCKVSFMVSDKVADKLKEGAKYAFRLTKNIELSYQSPGLKDLEGTVGYCKSKPEKLKSAKKASRHANDYGME